MRRRQRQTSRRRPLRVHPAVRARKNAAAAHADRTSRRPRCRLKKPRLSPRRCRRCNPSRNLEHRAPPARRTVAIAISASEVSLPRRLSMNHSAFPTGFMSLPVQPLRQCIGYSPGPFDGNCRIGGLSMPAALIAPGLTSRRWLCHTSDRRCRSCVCRICRLHRSSCHERRLLRVTA